MAVVYSYLRYSTPDQGLRGDSERRQMQAARKWAAERGHHLDETLRDDGVSAFRGLNLFGDGPLARFIGAVAIQQVEKGSILLLESWDRFSRQGPWDALPPLQTLINNGITVVTLIDGKEWTREAMRTNPMAIIESIFVMFRAWEESRTKSKRIKDLWAERRRKAAETGAPITARAPGWVKIVGEEGKRKFVLDDERVAVVVRIYGMAAAGDGQEAIARALNRDGVPCWGNGKKVGTMWRRPHVKAILRSRAPGGFHTPMLVEHDANGKASRKRADGAGEIAGYFPPAVDEGLFLKVHAMNLADAGDRAPLVRDPERSALAGLCRCAKCGEGMTRVAKGRTARSGRPRLVCASAKMGKGCEYLSVPAQEVEDAILGNAPKLALEQPDGSIMQARARSTRDVLEMLDGRAANLAGAIGRADDAPDSDALIDDLRGVERQRREVRMELAEQQARAEAARSDFVNARVADLWELADAPERDAPKINAALRQLFDAVVVDVPNRSLSLVWKSGYTSWARF